MKIAVSIVLTRGVDDLEVYWVRRGDTAPFLSGFHSFPGGFLEDSDRKFADYDDVGAQKVAGIREVFEETGRLVGVRSDRHRELDLEKVTKADPLSTLGITFSDLELSEFRDLGTWLSPAYLVTAFSTRFFRYHTVDFPLRPLRRIKRFLMENGSDRLMPSKCGKMEGSSAPPTRHILKNLVELKVSMVHPMPVEAQRREPTYSPIRSDVMLIPMRTPTLPPATHTNCYVLGRSDLWVVEPAAQDQTQLNALFQYLDGAIDNGACVRGILLTHHHDHIGGVEATMVKYGIECWAHEETARRLTFPVAGILADGDVLPFSEDRAWRIVFTPGHAPGHICLFSDHDGTMIVGDMIAGVGTILIDLKKAT